MPYQIRLTESARADAGRISAFHVRTILSMAQTHLAFEPMVLTRAKKPLRVEHVPTHLRDFIRELVLNETATDPWELRVGRWRAIYVLVGAPTAVRILRIFEKPEHLDLLTALSRWDGLDYEEVP